ncbi:hypothetical protein N752_27210 [Desulforamulus aquiferis]|nr:hypothetical protein N752_27210 [Desulforamulus aquiferis]
MISKKACQTKTTEATGTTKGVMKIVRNRLLFCIFLFSNKATPRDSIIFRGTQIRVNLAVFARADKKLGFLTTTRNYVIRQNYR